MVSTPLLAALEPPLACSVTAAWTALSMPPCPAQGLLRLLLLVPSTHLIGIWVVLPMLERAGLVSLAPWAKVGAKANAIRAVQAIFMTSSPIGFMLVCKTRPAQLGSGGPG